jgi:hypothetical protein
MFSKMVMFAASIASRGFNSKKIDESTKKLRALSCFGHGEIPACIHLKPSKIKGKHYCGKCGCGDHRHTWLIKESKYYSKLDYPKLDCPLKMPGFSNYDPNAYEPETKARKQDIENFDPDQLQFIQITIGSNPLQEKIMEDLNKVIEDS